MARPLLKLAEIPETASVKEARDATRGFDNDPGVLAWALKLIEARDDWANRVRRSSFRRA